MASSTLDKLARLLVRYSTEVRHGESVDLKGSMLCGPLQSALQDEVERVGGQPYWKERIESPDVFICCVARDAEVGLPTSRWQLILELSAQGRVRWVVAACPCRSANFGIGLGPEVFEQLFVAACFLDQPDPADAWRDQSMRQARLIDRLRDVRDLRLIGSGGTDLCVAVRGRTWLNGDGHENMPDGEVFTGPIEDATEGVLCFDANGIRSGRLRFRSGRVVDATALEGEKHLLERLDQDDGARVLGEVGFGCNERITQPIGHPLFDEKITRTFHVALGASFPATGARNQSGVHWDLVCDLRSGGRIEADGRLVNENGRWIA